MWSTIAWIIYKQYISLRTVYMCDVQKHSGVQNYSTAPVQLMKKLIIRSCYEMFVYTTIKNLFERRVQKLKAFSFIKFGKIHQYHPKYIAMFNLNQRGIEEDMKRCRKLKKGILISLYLPSSLFTNDIKPKS